MKSVRINKTVVLLLSSPITCLSITDNIFGILLFHKSYCHNTTEIVF